MEVTGSHSFSKFFQILPSPFYTSLSVWHFLKPKKNPRVKGSYSVSLEQKSTSYDPKAGSVRGGRNSGNNPSCFLHPFVCCLTVFHSFLSFITPYLGSSCSLQQCCPSSTLPDRARSSISSAGCSVVRQPSGCRAPGGRTRAGSHWTTSWETEIDTKIHC